MDYFQIKKFVRLVKSFHVNFQSLFFILKFDNISLLPFLPLKFTYAKNVSKIVKLVEKVCKKDGN